MINNYNWTLKISILCEDGIISDILCEGLACNGIKKLSDLKGDKTGLPPFLKEQAIYLEQFLNVLISCSYHTFTAEDIVKTLPQNLIKNLEFIWQGLNMEAKEFLCKYFGSRNNLLLALFMEKEQVFYNFDRLSTYEYEYKNKLLSAFINTLILYCKCFSDCIYFSTYFEGIVPKRYKQSKDGNNEMTYPLKVLNVNKDHTLEEAFLSLKLNLSVRSKNVLGYNGIGELENFLSWLNSCPNFNFLDFKNCGKKSAMELDDFRDKILQIATKNDRTPAPGQTVETRGNEKKATDYLANCLHSLSSNEAKDWILDNYEDFESFAMNFMSSPQSLFNRLCKQTVPSTYELAMLFCEFFAKTALLSDDHTTREIIQAPLKILAQLINSNRQTLTEEMLLTANKKALLSIEFNKDAQKLSTRTKNVLSNLVDENDCNNIVAFIYNHHNFMSLDKIGKRSSQELSSFQTSMRKYLAQILFSEENIAEYHTILKRYPFLTDGDIKFVSSFYSMNGHFPMFFLAERFLNNSKSPKILILREYYGIDVDLPKNLDEIAANTSYTRERVRQIVSSIYNWIPDETSLFALDNWKDYSFIFDDIISKESSGFQHISNTEHINLTFFAFCGIVRLVDDKIIETFSCEDGSKVCIAYTKLIKNYNFAKAIKELKRLSALNKEVDLIVPLYDFYANNEIYWSKRNSTESEPDKIQVGLAKKTLLILVRVLHIGEVDDNGNIIFKANKLNYADIIYNIIKSKGAPIRLKEIRAEFVRKFPQKAHNAESNIRSYIQKDERIESIGKTSTYKLSSWEGFSGSIPELLVRLLAIKGQPIQSNELAKEALQYRPNSTLRSITSNITQKVGDGTLCMYYPDFVGLADKNYGPKYKILPRTFDGMLKAFMEFVEENKRFPYLLSSGYEGMLSHWFYKAKKLITLSDSEIITLTKVIKKFEDYHYPHNPTESYFLSTCQSYKNFVSSTHRMVSDEDDKSMFSWFKKAAQNYLEWKDNRKFYFQDLLNFIRASDHDK